MTKFNLKAALAATLAATTFLAAPAMAQDATGSFTANASIVKPLTMTIDDSMEFGSLTLLPTLTAAENITVYWDATASAAARTCSANITCNGIPLVPHVIFSAGVGSQTVDLTYPSAPTVLTHSNVALTTNNTLAFSHTGPATFNLTNGAGSFYIGGTITVPANAVEGTYSATVPVEATYQ